MSKASPPVPDPSPDSVAVRPLTGPAHTVDGHTGRMQTLQTIIAKKSLIWDEKARILAPDGTRQNWLFDLRKTFLDPIGLEIAAEQFWELFSDRLPFQIGGLELGALPLVTAIQMQGLRRGISINGFIVRRERKNYGLTKAYEGELTHDPIMIVDDTFNSGTSAEKVRVVLAQEGRSIRDVFAIIDYGNPSGHNWITHHNLRLWSFFTLAQFGVHQSRPPAPTARAEFSAVWHFTESGGHYFDISPGAAPCRDATRVYCGSDDGHLWALNKRTGLPEWKFPVGGSNRRRIRSSPVVHESRIYFGSYDGVVHCVAAEGATELWRYEGADWIESSPCLARELGMLFIALEHSLPGRRGSIAALRMVDGAKVWEFSVEGHLQASPVFDPQSQRLACGSADGELLFFDPVARSLIWRVNLGGKIKSAVAFDGDRDAILAGTMDGSIHSVSISTGKVRWSAMTGGAVYSTPLVLGGRVLVTSTDKHLHVFDAENGKPLKRLPTLGKIFAAPHLFNGHIYFGTTAGIVYEIDPISCAVTGQLQLPERITDALAFDDPTGLLFARSYDGKLYAFTRSDASSRTFAIF
jgi:outer membrane protein assembly factor BamB